MIPSAIEKEIDDDYKFICKYENSYCFIEHTVCNCGACPPGGQNIGYIYSENGVCERIVWAFGDIPKKISKLNQQYVLYASAYQQNLWLTDYERKNFEKKFLSILKPQKFKKRKYPKGVGYANNHA